VFILDARAKKEYLLIILSFSVIGMSEK